jgi:hypothetical protein
MSEKVWMNLRVACLGEIDADLGAVCNTSVAFAHLRLKNA